MQFQYLIPQHALTRFAGWVAECRWPWLKNRLIYWFIKRYSVDMSAALIESPEAYSNFNSFFTRQLKPELRPIVAGNHQLASPSDSSISQIGKIHHHTLVQAKGFDFDLLSLLGGKKEIADLFYDGSFATLYLSPKDYHRVHMPFSGKLRETIYIPGQLFSVNNQTAASVPKLFARNERLVCLFDTAAGPMAVIMVGAMIVGSINTVWQNNTDKEVHLNKGEELGHFKLGSTVILLFAKNKIDWAPGLQKDTIVHMGQLLGILKS
jgi:phosphatidylserine decarboxylase